MSNIVESAFLIGLCTLLRELVIKQHGILHQKWINSLVEKVFTTKEAMNAYFSGVRHVGKVRQHWLSWAVRGSFNMDFDIHF